jgi:hypothetical protein
VLYLSSAADAPTQDRQARDFSSYKHPPFVYLNDSPRLKTFTLVEGNIADSTYQEYEAVLRNHVFPKFGDKLFSKITKPMMRD